MRTRSVFRVSSYGLLALGTLEIAARIDDRVREGAAMLQPYSINMLFRPSPLGREGVPGAGFGKWRMNSLGYRSPEILQGRANVLTYGASETFGLYEGPGKEYPRILEERLNASVPGGFNVVNIAIPGIRIGRMGYLERAMQQTQPHYIVVYPSPANYIGTTVPFCRQTSTPVASSMGVADHVRLAGKVNHLAKQIVPQELRHPARVLSIWWATRKSAPISQVPEQTLDAFREDLRCVVLAVQQRDAVPVMVTHATYFGQQLLPEDAIMMTSWRRFYPHLREEGFLDLERRANEVIRAIASEFDVPLVDAATEVPRGPQHFADFVHFTDEGADLFGDLIAEAIIDAGAAQTPLQ